MTARRDIPPAPFPPRGVSRVAAAQYVGVSPTTFDKMVVDGRMPRPKKIGARTVWDRRELDVAFSALPNDRGEKAPTAVGETWDFAV